MKITNKTKRTIAGILFLLIAAVKLFEIVTVLTTMAEIDTQDFGTLITLIFLGFGAIAALVLLLVGVRTLKQKKLGKGMLFLTLFAVIFTTVNGITTGGNAVDVKQYILPAVTFVAWYLLISGGGTTIERPGKKGDADKVEEQAEKQTSIYDQQLKAGILTKEEYNQLMKK